MENDFKILNNFCQTFETKTGYPLYRLSRLDILNNLSPDAKKILREYLLENLLNTNGIHKLLMNKFVKQPIIIKRQYLVGINYLCHMTHKELPHSIYLIGDSHTVKYGKGCLMNGITIQKFLLNEFAGSTKFIDYFLEIYHNNKHTEYNPLDKREDNFMFKTYQVFKDCFNKYPSCTYPYVRFHNADIRNTALSLINKDLILLNQIILLLRFPKHKVDIAEYVHYSKPYINMTGSQFTSFIYQKIMPLINKQLNNCPPQIAKKITSFFNLAESELLFRDDKIFQYMLDNYGNHNGVIAANTFVSTLAILQDYYTMSRIFRNKFKERKGIYSGPAYNSIVYAGLNHIKRLEDLLYYLDFDPEFKSFEDTINNFIDISHLKLPLFSC